MQVGKRLRHTPRKTPAMKLKPAHSRSQDMLQYKVEAVPIEERSRWAPPVEDDSDCDYEVMCHDHAMDPPPSAGLAAPGPPTPALLPSPPHAMEEYEVEYTPPEPLPCASVQSVPLEGWDDV